MPSKKYIKRKLGYIPPKDWTFSKFGKVLDDTQYGITTTDDPDGKYEMFKMNNYKNGRMDPEGLSTITISDDEYEKYELNKGDLLFNRTNSHELVGKTGIYDLDGDHVFASYLIRLIVDRNKMLPEYANLYLNFNTAQQKLDVIATKGVSQSNINPTNLKRHFYITYPGKKEQKRIVEIFFTWDRAITTLEQLIKTKKCHKKGLMQQLLSGKKRFPDFINSTKSFETKFGYYPKDWCYVRIRNIAEELKETNGTDSEKSTVLSCTKYDGLVDSLEYFDRQVYSDDLSNYKVVQKGDFAYATNHIEEGSIGYNDWCENGLISPMYTVFRTDNEKVNDHFLYNLFKTEKYRHIFEINTNGTVNRRGSLRWKDFSNIRVPLPSREEQDQIAEVFRKADDEILLLEQKLQALKKQKIGLMQQLLTGKTRVN